MNNLFFNYPTEENFDKEPYPDFFYSWDEAVKKGSNPGFFEVDDLCIIIDIYLSEDQINRAKFAIDYAFKLHPDHEDLKEEILFLLNENELWNDLLLLAEKYATDEPIYSDNHKLEALLHLGMEEDAFLLFKKLKKKYNNYPDDLSMLYQTMGDTLNEIDLNDASIEVMKEALTVLGEDIDFYWILLSSAIALDDKENVYTLCDSIQKINPMDAETWNEIGNAYHEIGDTKREIEAFEFARSLGLRDDNMKIKLIYAYEKNGNFSKALECVDEYLDEYPNSFFSYLTAVNICTKVEDWGNALYYIEKAIEAEPLMDIFYLYKSNFLLQMGEEKKALFALIEGIQKIQKPSDDLLEELDKLRKQFPEFNI